MKRIFLASVRLPPAEDGAAAFLGRCEAKLVEIGVNGESIGVEIAKIRARLTAEAEKEATRLTLLRRAREEQRMAADAECTLSCSLPAE